MARRRQREQAAPATPPPLDLAEDGILSRAVCTVDSAADDVRVGSDYVHASSLVRDWCPRRHAIFHRFGDSLTTVNSPRSSDRILWAIGRAVENHIRHSMILAYGVDKFFGTWSCLCGRKQFTGLGSSTPPVCNSCNTPASRYGEFLLVSERLRVRGSPDMLMLVEDGLRVLEIKSKKLSLFEELTEPEADHVNQASLYVALLPEAVELPVSPNVTIFYGAKDYPRPGVFPYKDKTRPANISWAEGQMEEGVRRPLHAILNGDTSAPLPDKLRACSSPNTTTARNCKACTLCFQL
jgi:hypothetical protein